jgi:hypothetical protein
LIVALWMARHRRRAFSGGRSRILFEAVLPHIEALPQPRRRKHQVVPSH